MPVKQMIKPKPFTVDKFLGLNCDNQIELNPGESPDMLNFRITNDYNLLKREGITTATLTGTAITSVTRFLKSFYTKLATDSKEYLYVIRSLGGSFLNIIKYELLEDGTFDYDSGATISLSMPASTHLNTWIKNGYLYIMFDASGSSHEGFAKYNGTTVSTVTGTIPTLYWGCTFNLSNKASCVYQPINRIINQSKVVYIDTWTNGAVVQLPETGLASINSVYIDGTGLLTLTTDYTVSASLGTVTATAARGTLAGATVTVTYTRTDTTSRATITKNQYNIFYGGANNSDLFIWGNPDHKNTVYHTYGGDVEFWSALNYRDIGNAQYAVTDIVVQNTRQVIFTEKEIYSAETEINTSTINIGGTNTTLYRIEYTPKKIAERGTPYYNKVQIIENNPFFATSTNFINELTVSTYRDDRQFKYRSKKVQKLLTRDDTIIDTLDWEAKSEYMVIYSTPEETQQKKYVITDDWDVSTVIRLPETGLTSVDSVYINGTGTLTPTTDYTVDLTLGTVTATGTRNLPNVTISVTFTVGKIYALIYNYVNDTWYRFDNLPSGISNHFFVEDDLYFGGYYNAIYKYDDSLMDDYGNKINAYWTSPYMNYGSDILKKSVNKFFLTLSAEDYDSYLKVLYFTNEDEIDDTTDNNCEFELPQGNPKELTEKISAKRFQYLKFKFISDKLNYGAEVLNFTTTANYGGYVRG